MSNDHVDPHFAVALNSFLPRRVDPEYLPKATLPPPHRVFAIAVCHNGQEHDLNILAPSWFVAWSRVVELLELPDDLPAEGFAFTVKPAAVKS